MIYSKKLQRYVPVSIEKKDYPITQYGKFTKYIVTANDVFIPVGFVVLKDTQKGVYVEYIENKQPKLYSGFGKVADQIEVEHCLNRKMDTFEITSEADLNSHAYHYKRGKRFKKNIGLKKKFKLLIKFKTADVNKIVKNIINMTKDGEQYETSFLEKIPMYMPKELIQKYMEIIKKNPLLK